MKHIIATHYKEGLRLFAAILLIILASRIMAMGLLLLPVDSTTYIIDWKVIWLGLEGGTLRYGTGIRNPPWSLIPIIPLGFFSFLESWILLSLGTLLVTIISVPIFDKWQYRFFGISLLITAYPSMRHLVDGNLEALVIGGILLVLSGYASYNPVMLAFGMLLASAKPQETWLVFLVIILATFYHWSRTKIASYIGLSLAVVVPMFILFGRAWLDSFIGIEQRGSIMDASLMASLGRLEMPPWLIFILWAIVLIVTLYIAYLTRQDISRYQAAFLVSAALLLSPYAAGNSLLTILAIGIIPLLFESPLLASILLLCINAQYFFPLTFRYQWGATYAMMMFLLCWFILGLYLYKKTVLNQHAP